MAFLERHILESYIVILQVSLSKVVFGEEADSKNVHEIQKCKLCAAYCFSLKVTAIKSKS